MVETRMSTSPATNRRITSSSSSAGIWPWATPTRARGASDRTLAAMVSMVSIRLWTDEHLAAAIELPGERLLQQAVIPGLDEGQDGGAVARRRLDQGQVPQAPQARDEACAESASR